MILHSRQARLKFHLAIILLGLATVFTLMGCSNVVASKSAAVPASVASAEPKNTNDCGTPKVVFTLDIMATGPAYDGTHLDYRAYKGSNGTKLQTVHGEFSSPEGAVGELSQCVKHADKVIEQGPKLDDKGNTIGERAEILFGSQPSSPPVFAVLWTSGSGYEKVSSSCEEKVLEVEKNFKN